MKSNELEMLRSGAEAIGVPLSDDQLTQFARFAGMLEEWNQRLNLTRIKPEEYVTLHFLDSLVGLTSTPIQSDARIIDVGTGAGFPGIPIKIARPDLKVTFLDSTRKKLAFVDEVIKELGLGGCQTVHARAEEAARLAEHRRKYDVAFARAVARLDKLAGWLMPFVKPGGVAVALKSGDVGAEVVESGLVIKKMGGTIEVVPRTIPGTEIARTLIVISNRRT